jgi:hypothetical protein
MRKLAIFVEGQTEQIFIGKLLKEIAGDRNLIVVKERWGDHKGRRIFTVIDAETQTGGEKYYILIRDCGGESNVQSDIRDTCENLSKNGYMEILGLRDVAPIFTYQDVPVLLRRLMFKIPTKYIPIKIMVAIMEIEAWFLAETTHFLRIHNSITKGIIIQTIGFDPDNEDVEKRQKPSEDLHNIYKTAGFAYTKKRNNVNRTVHALDYNNIYLNVRDKVPGLKVLLDQLDSFFTQPPPRA